MALKIGTESKPKVIAVGVLFCIVAGMAIYQVFGSSNTPTPVPRPIARPTVVRAPATSGQTANSSASSSPFAGTSATGGEARLVANASLDPALHLEKLRASESIEYAGSGRNIFSAESAPVQVEAPVAPARPSAAALEAANQPPPIPQPPQIDLHYFGYSSDRAGKREAFLLHGDDIFEAAAGEIVNHRYKVVQVDLRSIQITDLSYNNTQTLPLTVN